MALKLMYITKDPQIARIAEQSGVDRIFVDMEFIGKQSRQGGMDTVQNRHTIDDIRAVRSVLTNAELMVRINPIHEAGMECGIAYEDSHSEIEAAIEAGADVIMLPYFKTAEEVQTLIQYVDGRAKVFPLLETPEAVNCLDEILALPGLDEIHIGLNDLSLGMKSGFMFGLLTDGTVEGIAAKCKEHHIPFGFGGIASLGKGMLPAEYIIGEHYRLGSQYVILSRSFCNTQMITDLDEIRRTFADGVEKIRELEQTLEYYVNTGKVEFFDENRKILTEKVTQIQQLLSQKQH